MDAVTTSIDSSSGGVIITWNEPSTNSGAITAYKIEIADGTTSSYTENAACVGSSSTIISTRTCTVPMSVFTSAPYSYGFNALIVIRATATNAYGTQSTYSAVNTVGAYTR